MLTEIRPGVIASDDGFVVDVHEHFRAVYREGDRSVQIYKEPGVGGYIYWLDLALSWDPPFDAEPIDEAKRQEIRSRIIAALDFRGYRYHLG